MISSVVAVRARSRRLGSPAGSPPGVGSDAIADFGT
jgi:hypothetical protein